jgi:hypothetical protein
MGPPKKKPYREGVDQRIKNENHFEYRWDTSQGHYYLFNPYTGETILGEDYHNIDRAASMWHPKDKFASKEAYTIQLWPQGYSSRKWGIRKFAYEKDEHGELTFEAFRGAATAIQSAYRGHLAREWMRSYYRGRYFTALCKYSNYVYFCDRWALDEQGYDTVWTKPLLARPGDIVDDIVADPDDHMADGDKYSYRGFEKGPYLKQESLGKGNCSRAEQRAFVIENPWRSQAISKYEEMDLSKAELGDVIAWFDGLKVVPLPISNYVQVRAAICKNDWSRTLEILDKYPDQVLTRMYCYHSFSKTAVPLDGVKLSFAAADVLKRITAVFENNRSRQSQMEKTFMLNALHNLLVTRPGRMEFLSTAHINSGSSDERQRETERFMKKRVTMFNKYLSLIDMDVQTFKNPGDIRVIKERQPSPRGCGLVGATLQVLYDLSWEIELKEPMAENSAEYVYFAMKMCKLDGAIQLFGMRILYSLVYRCEGAQEFVLANDSTGLLRCIRENHGGDPEIEFGCRRLELALKFDGWRGNVERCMSLEIKGKKIPDKYLKTSPLERRFPDGFKFPLEEQEDERNAAVDDEENRLLEMEQHRKEEEAYRAEKAAAAKAAKAALAQEKKSKKLERVESKGGLQDTDENGEPVIPPTSDTAADSKGGDDDDILGRIANLESKIDDYKRDDCAKDGVEAKDGGDDDSVMSGLTLGHEEFPMDMDLGPDEAGRASPENVIQTPLTASSGRKRLDAKEAK